MLYKPLFQALGVTVFHGLSKTLPAQFRSTLLFLFSISASRKEYKQADYSSGSEFRNQESRIVLNSIPSPHIYIYIETYQLRRLNPNPKTLSNSEDTQLGLQAVLAASACPLSSRSNEERWSMSWNYSVSGKTSLVSNFTICFLFFLCKTPSKLNPCPPIWIPLLRCRPPMERALHLPCGGRAQNYLNTSKPLSKIPWKFVQSSSQISNALEYV